MNQALCICSKCGEQGSAWWLMFHTCRGKILIAVLAALLLAVPGPAQDQKIGKAVFKVVSIGDGTAIIQPVMPVQFTMVWKKGVKPLTDTFMTCEIQARAVAIDDKQHRVIATTVLRCKGEEFALTGVQFTLDQ